MRVNTTQEFDPERPIPTIVDFSFTGELIIGWDRTMRPPRNYTVIPPSKIAVEEELDIEKLRFYEKNRRGYTQTAISTSQQRLRHLQVVGDDYYENFRPEPNTPDVVYFANDDKSFYEKMKLINALELLITPDDIYNSEDVKKVKFTWDITAYSKNYIWM